MCGAVYVSHPRKRQPMPMRQIGFVICLDTWTLLADARRKIVDRGFPLPINYAYMRLDR